MHRHKVLLYLSMVGSSLIFLFMIVAFSMERSEKMDLSLLQFPKVFVLSTVILLMLTFAMSKVSPHFIVGNLSSVKKWLGITFLLGVTFTVCQLYGWQELRSNEVLFGKVSRTYINVISGLHLIHILGTMSFLTTSLLKCHTASKDPVQKLVYETNPYQKVKFEMLTDSWYFLAAMWLLLFFYFFFSC